MADEDQTEYAVMCAPKVAGSPLHARASMTTSFAAVLNHIQLLEDRILGPPWPCGPHRIVQRTVTPWIPVPVSSVVEQP